MNHETLPAALADILIQRLHPIADIAGKEVLLELNLHGVDMTFRVVARHPAVFEKEAITGDPVVPGKTPVNSDVQAG